MERFVVTPVFRATDGKYYMTGPGEKVYVRMSLENNNHLGFKRILGFKFRRAPKCYLDDDPTQVIYVSWDSNPDWDGGIQRSEAISEQYGYIRQSYELEPI
jgi:hypothetical protein